MHSKCRKNVCVLLPLLNWEKFTHHVTFARTTVPNFRGAQSTRKPDLWQGMSANLNRYLVQDFNPVLYGKLRKCCACARGPLNS